ncbi:flavin reductase family protein [Streptomyces sp. ODS05-4]|uniref:flavin reductase family protein n=1 Tax=Streptomyces sp. ODS05-4 TaxID=2944939 RepID=UPI0027E57800|nr:flavin reductase family protein [Streptomyces sp. ODS05-4]
MHAAQSPPRQPAVIASDQFRDAMARLAAPVTVVTTTDPDGRRWGFTASAVTSVSLDPPLILVGITRGSTCHQPLTTAAEFVVNVLADHHETLARRFAAHGVDRFAGGDFDTWPGTDLPRLADAAVLLRCTVTGVVPAGDHDLLLGAPVEARTSGSSGALVWYQRGFHVPVQTSQENKAAVRAA